jgi:hypothetical protein
MSEACSSVSTTLLVRGARPNPASPSRGALLPHGAAARLRRSTVPSPCRACVTRLVLLVWIALLLLCGAWWLGVYLVVVTLLP